MMKLKFGLFVLLACYGVGLFAQDRTELNLSVYFKTGSYQLKAEARKALDSLVVELEGEDFQILLFGNTDSVGNEDFNQRLSEQRVGAVRAYLIQKGFKEYNFLKTDAYGESRPVERNATETGKQRNRRVDVVVQFIPVPEVVFVELSCASITSDEAPPPPPKDSLVSIQELYKQIKPEPSVFCINTDRDTIVRCKKGTILAIPAGAFEAVKKGRKKCIEIRVTEVFDRSDMILANLNTMSSDGRIMVSQGMVNVEAFDNGKPILTTKKDYTIMTPTDTVLPEMKILSGTRGHDENLVWTVENNSVLNDFRVEDLLDCEYYCRCQIKCAGCRNSCPLFICQLTPLFPDFVVRDVTQEYHQQYRKFKKMNRAFQAYVKHKPDASKKYWRLYIKANNQYVNSLYPPRPAASRTSRGLPSMPKLTQAQIRKDSIERARMMLRESSICDSLAALFQKYGVDNFHALALAINKPLMDKYKVKTMDELRDAIEQDKVRTIETNFSKKAIAFEDFQYYVYNTSNLGWHNCDIFANFREDQLVNMTLPLKETINTDCKLVFKKQRSVITAHLTEDGNYEFLRVPRGEEVWVVAVRYENGKPLLAMHETKVGKRFDGKIEFKEYTLQGLKQALGVLDSGWEG